MVIARRREAWRHTSAVMVTVRNANAAKASQAIRDLNYFNPYEKRSRARTIQVSPREFVETLGRNLRAIKPTLQPDERR
jgi:hypothetical protein